MSKKGKRQKQAETAVIAPKHFQDSHRFWVSALVLMNLVFFWTPLTSTNASIQWDAADYYCVVQRYLSDELHAGRIPFWTPYVWSGFPFLADPQVGAWYPLNWPFFAMGVWPRTIQIENFLHSLLACIGAYFLSFRLLEDRRAACLTGLCYGLCGWFVGHSSHTTMVEAAAWLPWLILSYLAAQESRRAVHVISAILIAALIILAGHFQTILYSFLGLGLVAVAVCLAKPRESVRLLSLALLIPAGGTLVSAVAILPGLELAGQSVRAGFSAVARHEGFISPGSLLTLVYPDFYGLITGPYRGPEDITQYYLYAGLLVVPLALAGLTNGHLRWIGVLLIVFCSWYAAGHALGLYYLIAYVPGFKNIRAPINVWFVPALGLALLAGAGLVFFTAKWRLKWLPAVVLFFSFGDLWYWNSAVNPLAYARSSYDELYGQKEEVFERLVPPAMPPLTRLLAPENLASFGPMSHPLDARVEAAYGYGPLKFQRYLDYTSAMQQNPRLKNDLNISSYYAVVDGQVTMQRNADVLARANFPKQLIPVANLEQSQRALSILDPAQAALVPAGLPPIEQDAAASVEILDHTPGHYRMHYQARSDSVLRISVAYFPGWQALVEGRHLSVFCVDHALMGVIVPAGSKDLSLSYHSTYFRAGSAITLASLGVCVAALVWLRRRDAIRREQP